MYPRKQHRYILLSSKIHRKVKKDVRTCIEFKITCTDLATKNKTTAKITSRDNCKSKKSQDFYIYIPEKNSELNSYSRYFFTYPMSSVHVHKRYIRNCILLFRYMSNIFSFFGLLTLRHTVKYICIGLRDDRKDTSP